MIQKLSLRINKKEMAGQASGIPFFLVGKKKEGGYFTKKLGDFPTYSAIS